MEDVGGDNDPVSQLFDQFCHASTCKAILSSFQQLCEHVGLSHADHRHFYRRLRARVTTWKAQALWVKLDKRAGHKEYRRGEACANTNVIIIGGGLVGLRVAIETALLGARTVVVEKRDRFSRNNVLHLWPFLITDLKNLGAKKFFGKFCAGAIDHISIRQLQCILLKVALIVGVEVNVNVGFVDILEPTTPGTGWRIKVDPENHPLSEYEFDVLIGADGKRNTLEGFKRKEFRGKLAIAITANFINRNTQAEARVEEISGVAFIFNQKFFKDLYEACGIDLENIVYYKDETHYFVMTAKKQSLLDKGVLKRDYADTMMLLARDNVNQDALCNYAREAADFSTNHQLPHLDFAFNHYGQADIAMFDFTSLFQAENASRVVERMGHKLLMCLVGDSLLEPFWPTGSGCARGFLGAFDAAWMMKNWSSGKMTTLQVLAERESIYQLLSQTTPENLAPNFNLYTIDPASRYINTKRRRLKPEQVIHLFDTGDSSFRDEIVEMPAKRAKDADFVDTYSLLRWCQKILNSGKYHTINVTDLTSSWKSGLAFCALVHYFKPEAIDYNSLNEADVRQNNQLAFDKAQEEFGISPVMTGEDMANCEKPDKLTIVSYLSQFHDIFKKQRPPSDDYLNSSFEDNRKHRSPSHRLSILQKLRSRTSLSKLKKSKKDTSLEDGIYSNRNNNQSNRENINNRNGEDYIGNKSNRDYRSNKESHVGNILARNKEKEQNEITNRNIELTKFKKLPMEQIASKLTTSNVRIEDFKEIKSQEEMKSAVKVSDMAEILVSKFKNNCDQPPQEPVGRKLKGQPTLLAAQPASEFCFFCKKRVYIMERMTVENIFFHSQCFKCDHCGVKLRMTNYSVDKTSYGDAKRFFCFRHSTPVSRFSKPKRKRSAEDFTDDVYKENIPDNVINNVGPTQPKVSTPSRSPKKTSAMLTSPSTNTEDFNASLKTPERVEFENTIEGLPEETEEEQQKQNLRASISADSILGSYDEDEDSSDSDLEDEEQEDFQAAVDLYKSGQLEQSLSLAKETLKRSVDNLGEMLDREENMELGYERLTNGEEADEDTEMEDSEYETDDSDTEVETTEPTLPSSEASVRKPVSSTPSDKKTPTAAAPDTFKAKADFFTSPPEPLRLDPFKMFGMARKSDIGSQEKKEEEVKSPVVSAAGDENVLLSPADDENVGESDAKNIGVIESDEGTDNQIISSVLDKSVPNDDAKRDHIGNTDDELDEAFVEDSPAEETEEEELLEEDEVDEEEEEFMEKTAVSRAMEKLLEDMDRRSESAASSIDNENRSVSVSSSNEMERRSESLNSISENIKEISDNEDEDDVFVEQKPQISSKNSKAKADFFTSPPEPIRLDVSKALFKGNVEIIKDSYRSVRSASSDNYEKENSGSYSRSEIRKHTRRSRSSSDADKKEKTKNLATSSVDFTDTEKSVLQSVQLMSDNGSTGSGETTLQVLRSVDEIKEPSDEQIPKCLQYLDDRFVTQTRGHPKKRKIRKSKPSITKSSSSDSFTISPPSQSPLNLSSASLSEEFNYNKQFVSEDTLANDDEKPDADMLKDYQIAVSQVLDEDEMSPQDVGSIHDDDLDQTLHADEINEPVSPQSEYLSPRSDLSGVSANISPRSDRNSSIYETPNSSWTDKTSEDVSGKLSLPSDSKSETPEDNKNATTKAVLLTNDRKKKMASSRKPLKVIRQDSRKSEGDSETVPFSSNTLIRPHGQRSREGSAEPQNFLERDAWGSRSSSCSSVSEETQPNWRPLPPVPVESSSSPKQSKTFKQGTGRKLPDTTNLKNKNGGTAVAFQSNFMKKAFGSPTSTRATEQAPEPLEKTNSGEIETPVTSQARALPPRPVEIDTESKTVNMQNSKPSGKTKILVDYSKIKSDSEDELLAKRKKIPVDKAVKSAIKPKLSNNRKASPVNSDDIPFADDSEDGNDKEMFFTPATSVKPKKKIPVDENVQKEVRKRLLPSPPNLEPAILSADHIRDIKKAEIEKAREKARERARLKSDDELGLKDMDFTPGAKYKRAASQESSGFSGGEIMSDSDNLKEIVNKGSVTFANDTPTVNGASKQEKGKKKKKKSRDRDDSASNSNENLDDNKKEKEKKKRSLVSVLQMFKTPTEKPKELKEKDRSSSNDTLEDKHHKKKKSKTPKSEKKKDKKKRKSESDATLLSDNLKDLKIGSVFTEGAGKRPGFQEKILPPKASDDDLTDSDEDLNPMTTSMTALSESLSRRFKSDHGPLSEEELNAKITRKIQQAALKQQKQQEQKRLRQAQEIQRKLQEVDVRQRQLEERGVVVERALRGEGPEAGKPEPELMQDWFNLVHEKNALVRLESELMVSARELELEDRQGRLQQQLRDSMSTEDSRKSKSQLEHEQRIYNELIEVVDERDKLVAMLEEERVREQEEDRDLENVMRAKGYSLSPTSGSKILKKAKPVKPS